MTILIRVVSYWKHFYLKIVFITSYFILTKSCTTFLLRIFSNFFGLLVINTGFSNIFYVSNVRKYSQQKSYIPFCENKITCTKIESLQMY